MATQIHATLVPQDSQVNAQLATQDSQATQNTQGTTQDSQTTTQDNAPQDSQTPSIPPLIEITNLAKVRSFSIPHTADESKEYTITNKTGQNALLVLTLNAGSGDINSDISRSDQYVPETIMYHNYNSIAGQKGNDIMLLYNDTLKYAAIGGSGSLAGVLMKRETYRRSRTNTGSGNIEYGAWYHAKWEYWDNANKIAREGETKYIPLVLMNNHSITIKFVDNGARGNIFKGSAHIDLLYYVGG